MNTQHSEFVESNGRSATTGGAALAISNAIVRTLRVYAGRGPTKARTTIASDLVVVHLRECLTVAEKTLSDLGKDALVSSSRSAIHEAIREDATAAVEEITGQRVLAYLSDQQTHPDHALIAFVLEPRAD